MSKRIIAFAMALMLMCSTLTIVQADQPVKTQVVEKYGIVDFVGQFKSGLARFEYNDKYGYIDLKGNIVIEPKYDHALDFHGEIAQIVIGDKWGVINKKGEYIIQPNLNIDDFDIFNPLEDAPQFIPYEGTKIVLDRMGNKYSLEEHKKKIEEEDEKLKEDRVIFTESIRTAPKYGLKDLKGNVIVKADKYELIESMVREYNTSTFQTEIVAKPGFYKVRLNGKVGVIDKNGKVIVEPIYYNVFNLNDDTFKTYSFDSLYGIVSRAGKVIQKPTYKSVSKLSDGRIGVVIFDDRIGDKYGYLDKNNKLITFKIPQNISSLLGWNEGNIAIAFAGSKPAYSCLIDINGKVLSGKYSDITYENRGKVFICSSSYSSDESKNYIDYYDNNGKKITKEQALAAIDNAKDDSEVCRTYFTNADGSLGVNIRSPRGFDIVKYKNTFEHYFVGFPQIDTFYNSIGFNKQSTIGIRPVGSTLEEDKKHLSQTAMKDTKMLVENFSLDRINDNNPYLKIDFWNYTFIEDGSFSPSERFRVNLVAELFRYYCKNDEDAEQLLKFYTDAMVIYKGKKFNKDIVLENVRVNFDNFVEKGMEDLNILSITFSENR